MAASLLKRLSSRIPFRSEKPAHPCAVLFTDMVGSTAVFAKDDPRALELLERHNAILYPIVEDSGGRVVKSTGDGFLAIFEHPADSTRAAVAMQKALAEANSLQPEEDKIHIRIGIHYGLVFERGGDVFGDTVNLAARVNGVAQTDTVFISKVLRDFLRANPVFRLESRGFFELKGIPEKVELFELTDAPPVVSASQPVRLLRRGWRQIRSHPILVLSVFLVLVSAGGLYFIFSPTERPSLAVLFFENRTGDRQLDWLEGGLGGMLVTGLSQYDGLRVVSRERVYEVLHSLGQGGVNKIDPTLTLQVGRRAEASLVLLGDFAPAPSSFYMNYRLLDVRGDVRDAGQLLVPGPHAIQGQVDELIVRVAQRLRMSSKTAAFKKVAQLTSASLSALNLFEEGENRLFRQQLDQAIDYFKRAVAEDPAFAQAYMRLFWAKSWKGDISGKEEAMKKAREHFQRLAPREQLMLEVYETYARVDLAAAKSKLRQLVDLYPDDKEARYRFGFELEAEGKFDEAITQYRKVLDLYPRFSLALHRLAYLLAKKGDTEGAMGAGEKIHTLEPREPKTYLTIGDIHVQARRYQEALARYREGSQLQPDFGDFLLLTRMANVERLRLDFSRARGELELYVGRASPLGRAYGRFLLGDLAFYTGDFNQALEHYHASMLSFLQLQQPNPAVHVGVRLADLLAFQGRHDEASKWLDQAEAIATSDPLRFVARRSRVVVLAKKGDLVKAEQALQGVERDVASLPKEPWRQGWIDYGRAQLLMARGQGSEAKRWLTQASSQIGRSAELGILLTQLGQHREAIKALSTAVLEYESLVLDPSYSVWQPAPSSYVLAYYHRGKAYGAVGESEKARQDLQKFVSYWGTSQRPEVAEAVKILKAR